LFLFLTVVVTATYLLSVPVQFKSANLFFLFTSMAGLGISLLLVWNEVDQHNPLIKEVCGGNSERINCNAVLASARATFVGISWSIWGFSYSAAFFLSQILFTAQPANTYLWSILSILVTPYILFSLYYQ